ncbi:MAG: PadR family transcriptional regulator [Patescibacteria group bacterium]|nr:PadR family transcriptional regulator [Patescibacteria group bacterium]
MSKPTFSSRSFLELLVMKLIRRVPEPANHIHKRMNALGYKAPIGTLYALIHDLVHDGLVEHSIDEIDAGEPRRCCFLTEKGRHALTSLEKEWAKLNKTVRRAEEG